MKIAYNREIITTYSSSKVLTTSVKLSSLWVTLIVFALFKPDGLELISDLLPINYILILLQLVYILYAFIAYFKGPISFLLVALFLELLFMSIGTIFKGSISDFQSTSFMTFLKIITLIMIAEIYIRQGKMNTLLAGIFNACFWLLVTNLIVTFLWNPQGIFTLFGKIAEIPCFLGHKNLLRNPLFLGFAAGALRDIYKKNKVSISMILYIGVGLLTMLLSRSTTATLTFVLLIILFVLNRRKKIAISPKIYGIIIISIFVIFVLVQKFDDVNYLITVILDKDLTLSNRTFIWDVAIKDILSSPIFGNGFKYEVYYSNPNNPYLIVNHAHNAFIDITARGGVLTLIVMITIIKNAITLLSKNKSEISDIISMVLFVFLITGIFGELWNPAFYCVLCLALWINKLPITSIDYGR